MYEILDKWWREGNVLQDMREAKIITLYKTLLQWNSRSGFYEDKRIFLLNIAGKAALARIIFPSLQKF